MPLSCCLRRTPTAARPTGPLVSRSRSKPSSGWFGKRTYCLKAAVLCHRRPILASKVFVVRIPGGRWWAVAASVVVSVAMFHAQGKETAATGSPATLAASSTDASAVIAAAAPGVDLELGRGRHLQRG